MKNENLSFSVKVLTTLGKLLLFIAFFPYQLVVNRKEGKFSLRSLAVAVQVERSGDEKGKKRVTVNIPGLETRCPVRGQFCGNVAGIAGLMKCKKEKKTGKQDR